MVVVLLLMVLGVMLSGFGQQMRWITYERRSFAKKEKDAAGGRDHQIVLYCGQGR